MRNVDLILKNLDYPPDKIFGSIPAGSSAFTHASVRHYCVAPLILTSKNINDNMKFPKFKFEVRKWRRMQ
jgi:hypothetical protein